MPKIADEYTVFKKNVNGKVVWCVYYRDPITGDRLNAISLQKIKRLFNTGRKGKEPIKDRDEARKLAERAYGSKKMQDLVLHKKKTNSVLLIDYVKSVWNYNTSSYIKERIEEGAHIEKTTCDQIYNCFVKYGEPLIGKSELSVKILDDSMMPYYLKNDKVFFEKKTEYKNGDDIIIATKSNILSVRKLYKYPKGIILQAMNPKYPSLNVNIMSPDMILGKVTAIHREIK